MNTSELPDGVIPFRPRAVAEPWLTKRRLADYFQVSERTIERWTSAGMPCLRVPLGRTVRYRVSSCEAWLEAGA
jgi:phage terminase Nu1 subunit (DNA packaging protein)